MRHALLLLLASLLASSAIACKAKRVIRPTARASALKALDALKRKASITGSDLDPFLGDADPLIRVAAVTIAGELNLPGALPRLQRAANDTEPAVQWAAVTALARLKDQRANAALQKLVMSPNLQLRALALRGLGSRSAAAAFPEILRQASHASAVVRYAALWALGHYEHPQVVQTLLPLLKAQGWRERQLAVLGIGGQRPSDRLLPPLLQACKDADHRVRYAAIRQLPKYGVKRAAPALIAMLRDRNALVKSEAVAQLELLTRTYHGANPVRWETWLKAQSSTRPTTRPKR